MPPVLTVMQMSAPGRPAVRKRKTLIQFHLNFTPSRCGATLKDSRSNIGSIAESLQMSHVVPIIDPAFDTHTQAHRQQDSK